MERNMPGEKQNCLGPPLPAGLPHVAYILLWYPLFTQPFIFREVENLRKVLPLKVYTLYGPNLRNCSNEMIETASTPERYGIKKLPRLFASMLAAIARHPRKIARLFRECVLQPWESVEIFGENLWAFGVGVYLAKRFKEDGIDIIYAPWPRGSTTAAKVASELSGLPYAMAVRGDNLEPADIDLADKLNGALFVRANNAADEKRIQEFDQGQAKGKTILVYNSLTLPEAALQGETFQKSGMLRILSLGRFDVTKGFDVLLKACAILKKKGVPFCLTLAGGGGKLMGLGNLENDLRRLRTTLELENEVAMPGLVNHNDLPAIMAEHDVFAAPCVVHESGRRDGIPNTVIEAMAFGLPVVATNVNALPEVVINGKTGLSVEQKDPEALAEALAWVWENPSEAKIMAANAAQLARSMFDPAQNSEKLAEAFISWEKKAQKCAA